jgi:hypothetical protein
MSSNNHEETRDNLHCQPQAVDMSTQTDSDRQHSSVSEEKENSDRHVPATDKPETLRDVKQPGPYEVPPNKNNLQNAFGLPTECMIPGGSKPVSLLKVYKEYSLQEMSKSLERLADVFDGIVASRLDRADVSSMPPCNPVEASAKEIRETFEKAKAEIQNGKGITKCISEPTKEAGIQAKEEKIADNLEEIRATIKIQNVQELLKHVLADMESDGQDIVSEDKAPDGQAILSEDKAPDGQDIVSEEREAVNN